MCHCESFNSINSLSSHVLANSAHGDAFDEDSDVHSSSWKYFEYLNLAVLIIGLLLCGVITGVSFLLCDDPKEPSEEHNEQVNRGRVLPGQPKEFYFQPPFWLSLISLRLHLSLSTNLIKINKSYHSL